MPNEVESMKSELRAAAEWWATVISKIGLVNETVQMAKFQSTLQHLMELRYTGHWYENQPWRGNAFRSVSVCRKSKPIQIDNMLTVAAQSANILDLTARLMPIYTTITMWVDPGECTVRYTMSGAKHETTLILYSRSNNPYTTFFSAPTPIATTNTYSPFKSNSPSPSTSPTSTSPSPSPSPVSFVHNGFSNDTKFVRYFPTSISPPLYSTPFDTLVNVRAKHEVTV